MIKVVTVHGEGENGGGGLLISSSAADKSSIEMSLTRIAAVANDIVTRGKYTCRASTCRASSSGRQEERVAVNIKRFTKLERSGG
jgi:hypothetical protein